MKAFKLIYILKCYKLFLSNNAMNLKFYIEKLNSSEKFKEFKKENQDCFLCSGFFIIDKQKHADNKINLDFYIPSKKEMFSFKLNNKIEKVPVENFAKDFIPEKISENINFDFEEIEKIIEQEFQKEKINKKIQKILFSLQSLNSKSYLIGTIFISGLGIIQTKFDLQKNKIIEFKKKSFFDMVKIIKKKK